MNPSRQNSLRAEVLLQLYGARPVMRSAYQIARECKKQGLDFNEQEIKAELAYLASADVALAFEVKTALSTEPHFKISGEGIRHYEQHFAA